MRTLAAVTAVLAGMSLASDIEERALERLQLTTDRLVAMGEDMVGEPVSGTLVTGDTVEVALSLDTTYSYHIHIWTNSVFNLLDFWVLDPAGEVAEMAQGDHTTLSLFPGSAGEHLLMMTLREAAVADSAGYAAALFHHPRVILNRSEDS